MTNSPDHPKYAVLQVRSSAPGESARQIDCQVQAIDAKRLSLVSRERVRVSTPVTLEYNDNMLLGEVMACTQDCDQQWHIELKLEQILTGLQSLMSLRERLFSESELSRTAAMALAGAQRR